jgi:hypothetical protein
MEVLKVVGAVAAVVLLGVAICSGPGGIIIAIISIGLLGEAFSV